MAAVAASDASAETRGAVRAAALLSIAGAVVGVASLLFTVEVARIGGASAYGGVGALLSLATLATFLASGIQYAVARRAVEEGSTRGVLRRGVEAATPWVALAVIALPAAPWLAGYLHLGSATPVILAAALFAAIVAGAVPAGLLIGRRRFAVVALANLSGAAVRLAAGAVMPRIDGVIDGALLASLIGSLAIVAVQAAALGAGRERRGAASAAEGLQQGGMAMEGLIGAALTAALWAIWNLPVVFARHWLGDQDASRFAVGQQLTSAVLFLSVPIATAFFPTLVRHRNARVAGTGVIVTLAVSVAAAALLAGVGPFAVPRMYGAGFELSATLLIWQGVGACVVVTVSFVLWATRATSAHTRAVAAGILLALGVECVVASLLHASATQLAVGPVIALAAGMILVAALATRVRRSNDGGERTRDADARANVIILNWKDPSDATAGGAELYVKRVAEIWAARGLAVTLLVPRVQERRAEETIAGVRYLRMGNRLTVFHQSRRHLRRHGDSYQWVVESVSTRPFLAHRVVRGRTTALYHQVADDVWDQEFAFPLSWLGRRLIEPRWLAGMRDARVVAVSQSTADDLSRHGVATTAIAHPGCDAPRGPRRSGPATPPRLVFLGRLCRTKRPHDAVMAFALVQAAFPGATLDVIGDGYLRRELEHRSVAGVRLHGFVDEQAKIDLLRDADVLLMPATREGWGIVAIEAAMQGVPVVGYDVGGVREAVVDSVTGVLTPPDHESLAAAAVELLRDVERWQRLSDAAQQRAAALTWERSAATLLVAATAPASASVPIATDVEQAAS